MYRSLTGRERQLGCVIGRIVISMLLSGLLRRKRIRWSAAMTTKCSPFGRMLQFDNGSLFLASAEDTRARQQ